MKTAGFQVYDERDGWHWRFVLPTGRVVADSADEYATRDQAVGAIEDLRDDAADASVTVVEHLAISVVAAEETWRWQLVDAEGDVLGESARTYADRSALDDEIAAVQRHASDVSVFDIEDFVFWVRRDDDGWGWRLVDEDRTVVATNATPKDSAIAVRRNIDLVRRLVADAGAIDYDPAAFEVTRSDSGWGWRLIDADERVVAAGVETYDTRDRTVAELDPIKRAVGSASILEIDTAAFELHETVDGWGWRLVDGNGDAIGQSFRSYPDRADAREAMQTIKDLGPGARTAVAQYE